MGSPFFGGGGRDCRKISHQSFPYPVFGRFTHSLSALYGHYLIYDFASGSFLWVMFVHIRQTVREQPDTGYRKSLLPYFTAIPVCCGSVYCGPVYCGPVYCGSVYYGPVYYGPVYCSPDCCGVWCLNGGFC